MTEETTKGQESYWAIVWKQFRQHRLGYASLYVIAAFVLVAIYVPLLVSSLPMVVKWNGDWYFPLFRYLFHTGFFTKRLDIFYNILMFTFPLFLISWKIPRFRWLLVVTIATVHLFTFVYFGYLYRQDPASDAALNKERYEVLQQEREATYSDPLLRPLDTGPSWKFDLEYINDYGKLRKVLRHHLLHQQDERLQAYKEEYRPTAISRWLALQVIDKRRALIKSGVSNEEIPDSEILREQILAEASEEALEEIIAVPTLWRAHIDNDAAEIARQEAVVARYEEEYPEARKLLIPLLEECQGLAAKQQSLEADRKAAEMRIAKIQHSGGGTAAVMERLQQELKEAGDRCSTIKAMTLKSRGQIAGLRRIVKEYDLAKAKITYLQDRKMWLDNEAQQLSMLMMPFVRDFHWEDDAGGEQSINKVLPWYEKTRINRKDLLSGLLFGIRISLVVGVLSVGLAIAIGVPVGAFAGYYGGKFDIIVSRILEIWEAMPTFFMLLLVVAITQNKSIFLVIAVIGLFGWTGYSRYIRSEVFKQRNLAYVEACQAMGFGDRRVIFSHILPNAIPPLLTLLPFSIMGAITSEAGLSFLGLGEEGSCSWGVLMDEGRNAFPGESYLLWPPAILLTSLLVAIALVGDALRDSLDPKLRR